MGGAVAFQNTRSAPAAAPPPEEGQHCRLFTICPAPRPAMARASAPHRRNIPGIRRSRQPIPNRGPDGPTPRTLLRRRLAGDQQQHARACRHRFAEFAVQQLIRGCQVVPVQVEAPIRLDQALGQPPVPAPVERRTRHCRLRRRHGLRPRGGLGDRFGVRDRRGRRLRQRAVQRCHAFDDAAPERRFLRAEPAYHCSGPGSGSAPARRAAAAALPARARPSRRRSRRPPRRRPRRYRPGSGR